MLLTLTPIDPDDANVDPNSSMGVDPRSSESIYAMSSKGVDMMFSKGVDMMFSDGVDMMLTQTPANLLSILIPNVCCQHIVWLPKSFIPIELITMAIAAIAGIKACYAVE
jgi:hypothetical protein